MERSNVSGMSIDEYRRWMKEDIDDLFLINESDSVDEIIKNMNETKLLVSAVNAVELQSLKDIKI